MENNTCFLPGAFGMIASMARRDTRHPQHCEKLPCSKTTQGGKPYCSEHCINALPYPQQIIAIEKARLEEVRKVEERGIRAVNLEGLVVPEILHTLFLEGPRTVERLARELRYVSKDSMRVYGQALVNAGRVTSSISERGITVLAFRYPKTVSA